MTSTDYNNKIEALKDKNKELIDKRDKLEQRIKKYQDMQTKLHEKCNNLIMKHKRIDAKIFKRAKKISKLKTYANFYKREIENDTERTHKTD